MAATVSTRLCGGMFVAMPTAMPAEPFTIRFGSRAGRTVGSCRRSSKLGTKSTVFLSMSPSIAMTMLGDIDKNTVDFVPNFDDRLQEPTVLPARLPNLIVNGSAGIAVGMATNIPPHNLVETVAAINHLVDHPDAPVKELRKFVKGPDFPTGAIIYGRAGIKDCYEKGRGRIVIRARATAEEIESTGKQQIVVTEFPYQVSTDRAIEQIRDPVVAT